MPMAAVCSTSRRGSSLLTRGSPRAWQRCRSRFATAAARARCRLPWGLHSAAIAASLLASSRALGLEVCSQSSARDRAAASKRCPWASNTALWARPPAFFCSEITSRSAPAAMP